MCLETGPLGLNVTLCYLCLRDKNSSGLFSDFFIVESFSKLRTSYIMSPERHILVSWPRQQIEKRPDLIFPVFYYLKHNMPIFGICIITAHMYTFS